MTQWYKEGQDFCELKDYEEALKRFQKAKRLGHPNAERAIRLCHTRLGYSSPNE
jgi:hypothetical protein